jgi:hypothetical protein
MTPQQFKDKYLEKKIDYDGVYGAACVDLAKQWQADNGGPVTKGNAIDWPKNCDKNHYEYSIRQQQFRNQVI